jgi:osmotically inducible protein OsmC
MQTRPGAAHIQEDAMPAREANAVWNGTLKEGQGTMRMGGGAYEGPYSFSSRFEEGKGTNPEELIAAAHAGCFSMALSGVLTRGGFLPKKIESTARVHLGKMGEGMGITRIELSTRGEVPGIDQAKFQQAAEDAKKNCPVSKALSATEIVLTEAKLLG